MKGADKDGRTRKLERIDDIAGRVALNALKRFLRNMRRGRPIEASQYPNLPGSRAVEITQFIDGAATAEVSSAIGNEVAADPLNGRGVCDNSQEKPIAAKADLLPSRTTDETSTDSGPGVQCCTAPSVSGLFGPLGNTCTPTCVADKLDGPGLIPAEGGFGRRVVIRPSTSECVSIHAAVEPVGEE